MTELSTVAEQNGAAIAEFVADAKRVPEAAWLTPRVPGKWSPAQVTEHLCLAYEVSQQAIDGSFPGASAPRFLRPIIRRLFLGPILKRGHFKPGAKAPGIFTPSSAPGPAVTLLPRLERASQGLTNGVEAESRAGRSFIEHPIFGRIPWADYLRLQAIHTRHHRRQLPGATPA